MPLLQLISRLVGASDIAWGNASFSYVDENGISHTMQQVNATLIPFAVTQDSSGNVTITGTLTVAQLAALIVAGNATINGSLTVTSTGNFAVNLIDSTGGNQVNLDLYQQSGSGAAGNANYFFQMSGDQLSLYNYYGGSAHEVLRITRGSTKASFIGAAAIQGLPAYTNNDTAKAAGLAAGDLYRIMHDPVNSCNPASVGVVY